MNNNLSNLNRREYLSVVGAVSVGTAGCLGENAGSNNEGDGDDAGSNSEGDGDDPSSASSNGVRISESDIEPVVQSWVEFESAAEKEQLLHPDSGMRANDPYYEWEFVRIHEVRGPEDGSVFVHYERERVDDGIYAQYEVELRRHDDEWLVYAEDSV